MLIWRHFFRISLRQRDDRFYNFFLLRTCPTIDRIGQFSSIFKITIKSSIHIQCFFRMWFIHLWWSCIKSCHFENGTSDWHFSLKINDLLTQTHTHIDTYYHHANEFHGKNSYFLCAFILPLFGFFSSFRI